MSNITRTARIADYEVLNCKPGLGLGRVTYRPAIREISGRLTVWGGSYPTARKAIARAKEIIAEDIADRVAAETEA